MKHFLKKFSFSLSSLLNLLIWFFLFYALGQRLPEVFRHFQSESKPAPTFELNTISGQSWTALNPQNSRALIFWATWCGPCEIELGRINEMIKNKEIPGESVVAISSGEDPQLVKQVVKERNYRFEIALDDGKLADRFQVHATPTVILLDEKGLIQWLTTGLSPLLTQRFRRHFDQRK